VERDFRFLIQTVTHTDGRVTHSLAAVAQITHQGSDIYSGIRTPDWPTVRRDVTPTPTLSYDGYCVLGVPVSSSGMGLTDAVRW